MIEITEAWYLFWPKVILLWGFAFCVILLVLCGIRDLLGGK